MRHWDEIEFWRRSARRCRVWFWCMGVQALLGWAVAFWLMWRRG